MGEVNYIQRGESHPLENGLEEAGDGGERVVILDAGAQYGKVGGRFPGTLRTVHCTRIAHKVDVYSGTPLTFLYIGDT